MSARLTLCDTPLAGPRLVRRNPIADPRGFLERLYCAEELRAQGVDAPIRQINRTLTREKGTVRGMHFQRTPEAETKMITCLAGRVFDVAVDLRKGSPTFGKWHGVELDGTEHLSFLIPEGFAHGFQTLTEDCAMLYLHTRDYAPAHEGGITPLDQRLAIDWPLPVSAMSQRDRDLPALDADFGGLEP